MCVRPRSMTKRDFKLLSDAYDGLECQFRFCEGPTLRPKHMITCQNCALAAKIAKRLGFYIPVKERDWNGEDWTRQEQKRRRSLACAVFGYLN